MEIKMHLFMGGAILITQSLCGTPISDDQCQLFCLALKTKNIFFF